MVHLRLLNLSGTKLKIKIPLMSNLTSVTNLTELCLGGCKLSDTVPSLEMYTKLNVLDLSKTEIQSLPSLENLTNLRGLKLRGCKKLQQLPDLKSFKNLESLDLQETGVKEFPYWISELTHLKHLDLPDLNDLKTLDWEMIKNLPEELNWDHCGIFKFNEKRPCMSLRKDSRKEKEKNKGSIQGKKENKVSRPENKDDKASSQEKKEDRASSQEKKQDKSSSQEKKEDKLQDKKRRKTKLQNKKRRITKLQDKKRRKTKLLAKKKRRKTKLLTKKRRKTQLPAKKRRKAKVVAKKKRRKTKLLTKKRRKTQLPAKKRRKAKVEIFVGIELTQAFEKSTSKLIVFLKKFIGVGNLKAMKGCWLERCGEMETIFCREDAEVEMQKNQNILWASNLPELKSVYSGEMPHESLLNLTELYLDCCPMLEVVFPSSQLPENLKILEVKFCDKLETLFRPTKVEEYRHSLQKLHLVELPKLTSMGLLEGNNIKDRFPSLKVKIRECPNLKNIGTVQELGGLVENSKIEEY
uniref:Disease resistance protein At4g27190-like leucine-rich repeats domain-containing protein n=1 Tax=Quercus lobata TaxID=97700 RepID=A0A7N2RED5_QUELO